MANNEALRATMDRVIDAAARDTWNQGDWVVLPDPSDWSAETWEEGNECSTAGCFAGHYAFSQGYTKLAYRDIQYQSRYGPRVQVDWVLINPDTGEYLVVDECETEMGNTVQEFARDGLGLDYMQQGSLFYAANSLDDLKHKVDQICAGEQVERVFD